jgi:dihydrofolate reductase
LTVSIALIVAVAKNGVVGNDNKLLWRLKTDLKRFRALTMGKPIIMGRKTLQSIGCLLPGRDTIVITRDPVFVFEGAHVVHSLPQAIELGKIIAEKNNMTELMIIGGAEIYAQALPLCEKLYVTEVDLEPEGDAFFSIPQSHDFNEIKRAANIKSHDDEADFRFVDYERRH